MNRSAGDVRPGFRVRMFATLLVTAGMTATVVAEVTPHGGQFQVNTFTSNSQTVPAAAIDATGRMVVVWASSGEPGDPSYGIQGQRFGADGEPLGTQFLVNTYTTSTQTRPGVAVAPNGDFVVVWESFGASAGDLTDWSIQAQRFLASGAPQGPQFLVNTYTTAAQLRPAVAMDAGGRFVVAWDSLGALGDVAGLSVHARRYDENGTPLGDSFQVNTLTTGNQFRPRVAADVAGNFWVVFETAAATGTDPDGSIQARFYDSAGVPVSGPEFTLNSFTTGAQSAPAIAADGATTFLAVWTSAGSFGDDSAGSSVQGYFLSSLGETLGDDFQVNTYTTHSQFDATVTGYAQSGFVVGWTTDNQVGGYTDALVQARRFGVGAPEEFQVNSLTTGEQIHSAVAADPRGNFLVVWEGEGSTGPDDFGTSIQGQRYDALFRDGFEPDGTSRWSAIAP